MWDHIINIHVYFEQFQPQPQIIWEGARGLLEEYQSFMEAQRIA